MRHSEIFQKAAQLLEREEEAFSCIAIGNVLGDREGEDTPAHKIYLSWFDTKDCSAYWLRYGDAQTRLQGAFHRAIDEGHDGRDLRILALCFMAAIAESEGE